MFWLFSPSRSTFTCYLTVYVDCIWVKNSLSSPFVFSFIKCVCICENIPIILTVGASYSSKSTFQSWILMSIHWLTVHFIHNMTHISGSKTTFQVWEEEEKMSSACVRKSEKASQPECPEFFFSLFLFIDSKHVHAYYQDIFPLLPFHSIEQFTSSENYCRCCMHISCGKMRDTNKKKRKKWNRATNLCVHQPLCCTTRL